MSDIVVLQLFTLMITSVFVITFCIAYKPLEDINIVIFNEVTVLFLAYFLLTFTQLITDGGVKFTAGWLFMGLVLGNIFVHFTIILQGEIIASKKHCKKK